MNRLPIFLTLILCMLFSGALLAQQTTTSASNDSKTKETGPIRKFNLLKVNITGLIVKNYALQYERVTGKSTSLAISFRTMPTTTVPLKGLILDLADEDPDTKQVLDKLKLSNFAITPEFRWYVGKKGYGRGFYIAPFYRYAKFKSNELVFEYDNLNVTENIKLSGEQSSHTGGILFGAQWLLGKSFCLDWWILGPHYGSGNGNFAGLTDHLLTPQEQNSLRQSLEDVDLPVGDKTVTVNANGASIRLSGPWAGLRAGLSFGIRF